MFVARTHHTTSRHATLRHTTPHRTIPAPNPFVRGSQANRVPFPAAVAGVRLTCLPCFRVPPGRHVIRTSAAVEETRHGSVG